VQRGRAWLQSISFRNRFASHAISQQTDIRVSASFHFRHTPRVFFDIIFTQFSPMRAISHLVFSYFLSAVFIFSR
jgi:hypothetical protein